MPVDSQHPDYVANAAMWRDCRAAFEGDRSVKAAGRDYLPSLPAHDADPTGRAYERYKARATFQGFTRRTVDAFTGMIGRKDPEIVVPEAIISFLDDVTDTGVPFSVFADKVTEEVTVVARGGVLVDHQRSDSDAPLTIAEASRLGLRPYWRWYRTEDVINWRVGRNGARGLDLVMVVLREEAEDEGTDEFTREVVTQYRVLDLFEGKYRQRVFREGVLYGEEVFPKMNGQDIDYIPFVFFGPSNTTVEVQKSPIDDLVATNLDHYRTTAEYKHLQFFCSAPVYVQIGVTDEETALNSQLGPGAKFTSANANAKFDLLQADANGATMFVNELARLKEDMAAIGARVIADNTRAAESGTALATRAMAENSVLASLARAVSAGLTMALEITRDWYGIDGDVSVKLNTNFLPNQMTAQDLREWVKAVQSGQVTQKLFRSALRQGELAPADYTDEQWEADTQDEGAGLGLIPRVVGGEGEV